jgi:preprotein translocase subunit SecE
MASLVARAREFGSEVAAELRKVTWPDWPQLRNSTWVILIFVAIVSLIIWLMDLAVRNVLRLIMAPFTG